MWITAVSQIFNHLSSFYYYVAYALGFATGTYIGMKIESRLSIGNVILRVFTQGDDSDLYEFLKTKNYSLTALDAEGKYGKVKLIFMVIRREELQGAIKLIKQFNPHAFYTVEDVRFVSGKAYSTGTSAVVKKVIRNGWSTVKK